MTAIAFLILALLLMILGVIVGALIGGAIMISNFEKEAEDGILRIHNRTYRCKRVEI